MFQSAPEYAIFIQKIAFFSEEGHGPVLRVQREAPNPSAPSAPRPAHLGARPLPQLQNPRYVTGCPCHLVKLQSLIAPWLVLRLAVTARRPVADAVEMSYACNSSQQYVTVVH